jgi:hypothetical protein
MRHPDICPLLITGPRLMLRLVGRLVAGGLVDRMATRCRSAKSSWKASPAPLSLKMAVKDRGICAWMALFFVDMGQVSWDSRSVLRCKHASLRLQIKGIMKTYYYRYHIRIIVS